MIADNERRRPRDYATVSTPRYRFRYDGRWLMTQVNISGDGGTTYGDDLVDRWKARAFAQDPGSSTPCCGFEEEDTNWGGSSTLLGEKVGPVRAIRETWGADSGTNVIRRETFYRDEMRQKTWLRVHVIPPLDGIYAQWDFNAGRSTRSTTRPTPAACRSTADDDDVGNFDDPCNPRYDGNRRTRARSTQGYRTLYQAAHVCDLTTALGQIADELDAHLSIDLTDPRFNDVNSSLGWSEVAGPHGTIVDRYQIDKATDLTAGRPRAVAGRRALLPRRLVLRRRHRDRPGAEGSTCAPTTSRRSPPTARRGSAGTRATACPTAPTTTTRARSARTACT